MRNEVNVARRLDSDKSYLVKIPVEENSAAYWNKLLILHEMIKRLLMNRVPILQQRDSLPKQRVKFSQSARWEVRVLLSDEVLVVPVTAGGEMRQAPDGCLAERRTRPRPGSRRALWNYVHILEC